MAAETIDLVLAVFREPTRISELRDCALPEGIAQVIRLAAGESAALQSAQAVTGETEAVLVEACVFFLQQLLFAPNADSYRVLGAGASDSHERLRENYRWLMKWLHPDRNEDGWEAVYADRVNIAWQDLKTPSRRAEYDLRSPSIAVAPTATGMVRVHSAPPSSAGPLLSGSTVRRLPAMIFGALSAAAAIVVAVMYWAQVQTAQELAARSAAVTASIDASSDLPAPSAEPSVSVGADDAVVHVAGPVMAMDLGTLPASASVAVPPSLPLLRQEGDLMGAAPSLADSADLSPRQTPEAASGSVRLDGPTSPGVETSATNGIPTSTMVAQDVPPQKTELSGSSADTDIPAGPPRVMPERTPTLADSELPAQISDSTASSRLVAAPTSTAAQASDRSRSRPAVANQGIPPSGRVSESSLTAPVLPAIAEPIVSAAPTKSVTSASVAPHVSTVPTALMTSAAPAPIATTAPTRRTPGVDKSEVSAAMAIASSPAPAIIPDAVLLPPADADAEAVVREFAAAYAAGDLARFDRLFAAAGNARDRQLLRSRFGRTEMRYLEIKQLQLTQGTDSTRVSALYRDTYVPRGGRKSVTRVGTIAWLIRLDAGNARIAELAFEAGNP
jgi:hypothetical protein